MPESDDGIDAHHPARWNQASEQTVIRTIEVTA
jgi:hypothetical protein